MVFFAFPACFYVGGSRVGDVGAMFLGQRRHDELGGAKELGASRVDRWLSFFGIVDDPGGGVAISAAAQVRHALNGLIFAISSLAFYVFSG